MWMALACAVLSILDKGARVGMMRRIWETIGGVALAIVTVSCGSDSTSNECVSTCNLLGAEECYTFGSGEQAIVARARCVLDEQTGCAQWNLVEECEKTCEKNVCDFVSDSAQCNFPCNESGAEGCYTFDLADRSVLARARCEYSESAGCLQWSLVEACDKTCEANVCDPVVEPGRCDFPCSVPGASECHTFESGGEKLLGRAVCVNDEKAGCKRWSLVEECNDTCEENVCDPVPGGCVSDCLTVGERSCRHGDVVECQEVDSGCLKKILVESCEGYCDGGQCKECPTSCTEGSRTCFGYVLKQCKRNSIGCLDWEDVKQCEVFCSKETGSCSEDLPACKLTNGATATVVQWTDGDTLWLYPESKGLCNEKKFDPKEKKWKNIRWRARIHGIDAPECTKERNKYYYYTCIKDSVYTDTNEPYGYEAWDWAQTKLPFRTEVVLTCDKTNWETGACQYDATADDDAEDPSYNRYLVYLGYSEGSASYDYSTEIARKGLAFSNTKFASSKRSAICRASKEAKDAKVNIWSLADTVSGVLEHMGYTKQRGLKNMPGICGW